MPLTADRAKPAVPFGGRLPADRLRALEPHQLGPAPGRRADPVQVALPRPARLADLAPLGMLGSYVASVPAQQRLGKRWFSGSADAILQSLNLIRDEKPDIVVVVGADHVYRMDFSQMIEAHIDSGAGVTVAAIRQPIALADQFGVIEVDANDPTRIAAFREKPKDPMGLADSPDEVLASMGNYVFDADVLIDAVQRDGARPDSNHDMGGDIVPDFVARGQAGVYDFKRNDVPGSTDRDRSYWRDVGNDRVVLRRPPGPHLGAAGLQPLQPRLADLQPAAQLAARQVRARRAGQRSAPRSTRSSRSAASSPAPTSSAACSGRGPSSSRGRRSSIPSCSSASASRPNADRAARYSRQGCRRRGRAPRRRRPRRGSRPRLHGHRLRHHRRGQGRPRPGRRRDARLRGPRAWPVPRRARRRLHAHRERGHRAARRGGGLARRVSPRSPSAR